MELKEIALYFDLKADNMFRYQIAKLEAKTAYMG